MNQTARPIAPFRFENFINLELRVLDKGFVRLIDYMGNEAAIVQAARVSYGIGTKSVREDEGLIRYLWTHEHTSPFEMCEIKLHCKMPIFVARQWVRHRTASINEYSLRYSEAIEEFYLPETFHSQDQKNKQGSAAPVDEHCNLAAQEHFKRHCRESFARYRTALDNGISREEARMILPLSTYTMWYWKIDLHNLLHFLKLRLDPHAQWEIREYGAAIGHLVHLWLPTVSAVTGLDKLLQEHESGQQESENSELQLPVSQHPSVST